MRVLRTPLLLLVALLGAYALREGLLHAGVSRRGIEAVWGLGIVVGAVVWLSRTPDRDGVTVSMNLLLVILGLGLLVGVDGLVRFAVVALAVCIVVLLVAGLRGRPEAAEGADASGLART